MMLLFCVAIVGAAIVIIYSNIIALYEDIFNIKYRSVMLDCRGRLDYLKKCMYDKSPSSCTHHHLPLYCIYVLVYIYIYIDPYINTYMFYLI